MGSSRVFFIHGWTRQLWIHSNWCINSSIRIIILPSYPSSSIESPIESSRYRIVRIIFMYMNQNDNHNKSLSLEYLISRAYMNILLFHWMTSSIIRRHYFVNSLIGLSRILNLSIDIISPLFPYLENHRHCPFSNHLLDLAHMTIVIDWLILEEPVRSKIKLEGKEIEYHWIVGWGLAFAMHSNRTDPSGWLRREGALSKKGASMSIGLREWLILSSHPSSLPLSPSSFSPLPPHHSITTAEGSITHETLRRRERNDH